MNQENIKTKINFHFEGQSRPFASTEDFETLKRFLYIKSDANYETQINEVEVDGKIHTISSIQISILKETSDLHLTYGLDMALAGEPMPYNFRVSVFLKK